MGSEWKKAKLTDHYDIRSGLSKPAKDFGSGYPFLTFKNVFYNYFVPSELTELVQSTEKEREGCSVQRGDVFLTRTSETMNELGMSCVALKSYENASFNGFCKRLRPKPESDLVPEYVGYYLRSPRFRNDMLAFSTMSTRASLNNDMIGRLDISYPSPDSQKKIAHVLKSLDNKITVNNQINQTLEQMAQTLFKSWFVDFDPVKAKMNGEQPKGMDAATASLFPEKLVESELGLIPEGWDVGDLSDLMDFNPKRTLKKGAVAPYLDMKNMPTSGHLALDIYDREMGSGTKFVNGDSLLARITPCIENGKTAYVDFLEDEQVGWGSTEYIVMRSKSDSYKYFSYYMARFEPFRKFAIQSMTGSSGRQRAQAQTVQTMPFVIPPVPFLEKFDELITANMLLIKRNGDESKTLSQLRDTLLPKLLSGEIDLENLPVEQAKALAE
ncbi:restriction endonuclease subunit S [Vibrio kanaloae]|uniref:Restriction endonuclease subunit S n=1 Tax=Vibrio kanaloae TaxID=170673 RepID=A0A4U1Z1W7_9VIBR|nr:restriction endonuclease subunit S [Vibrio kanaloae]TKF26391.1 restriction endonuclease subunit S [Vibrio kanaloae]